MGNSFGRKKSNQFGRLAQVEVQVCMQFMDRTSRLRFARVCHSFLITAENEFAWKFLPPLKRTYQVHEPTYKYFDPNEFRMCHSLIRFVGLNVIWNRPQMEGKYTSVTDEIKQMRQFPNIRTLIIKRSYDSTVEAVLNANDNLSHIQRLSMDGGGSIDFIHTGSAILTFHHLQDLQLPDVTFSFQTYQAFTQLPELNSFGFSRINLSNNWSEEEFKSLQELHFRSTDLHLQLTVSQNLTYPALNTLVLNLFSQVVHLRVEDRGSDLFRQMRRMPSYDWLTFYRSFTNVRDIHQVMSLGDENVRPIFHHLQTSPANLNEGILPKLTSLTFQLFDGWEPINGDMVYEVPPLQPHHITPTVDTLRAILCTRPQLSIQLELHSPRLRSEDSQIFALAYSRPLALYRSQFKLGRGIQWSH